MQLSKDILMISIILADIDGAISYTCACVCMCAYVQVCKYASMQVYKYTSIQVYKYTSMQVCKYTSIQVYKYASIHIDIITYIKFNFCFFKIELLI